EILSSVFAADHWVRERNRPNAPPISLERPHILNGLCRGDFPHKPGTTAIRCNDGGISLVTPLNPVQEELGRGIRIEINFSNCKRVATATRVYTMRLTFLVQGVNH